MRALLPSQSLGIAGHYLFSTYLPTKFSKTELLPADCPPTTAIWGRSNVICTPRDVNASCNLFTIGIKLSIPKLVVMIGELELIHVFTGEEKTNFNLFYFFTSTIFCFNSVSFLSRLILWCRERMAILHFLTVLESFRDSVTQIITIVSWGRKFENKTLLS